MKSKAGRIVSSVLRWLVAALGVAWVVSNLHWHDRVLVVDAATNVPAEHTLAEPAEDDAPGFVVDTPGGPASLPRGRIVNGPDRKSVTLDDGRAVPLLGMWLGGDINRHPAVDALIVADPPGHGRFIKPSAVKGGFVLDVPQPRVQHGLGTMLRQADSKKLALALLVGAVPFFFTTVRWQRLLAGLGVTLSFGRAFVLNMVGAFYNTFMPGSTGGDVLKAYYVARHAPDRRTAAVMSVIVDRVLGLITLVMLGGAVAGFQWFQTHDQPDPVTRACRRVALGAVAILLAMVAGLVLLYTPAVRRQATKIDRFVRSRAYSQLQKVMGVMHAYRSQPGLFVWAFFVTLPVHLATVVSALFAGQAFGLKLTAGYYFIVVPVVVLAGAIPISPQGVGVMEAFAYYFTRQQGATLNQALALTLSIRLVAVFWNLVGGLFVLRGGYHAPTDAERENMDSGPIDPTAPDPAAESAAVAEPVAAGS